MTQPPSPVPTLRLGTRRSLLALAQSSWVARQIEGLNPGLRVELVGIETKGDQLLDVLLSTAPGREFFVAELDAALLEGKVDFTVHSHKDLSLERPPGVVLAATPPRANPRDVIVFGPATDDRLAQRLPLRIGTGAPRRIANLADFLPAALPGSEPQPPPEFVSIRGNVDTRLSRIHLPESHERHIDAAVLALAGLSRLFANPDGRTRLTSLLAEVSWMVLPLQECPTAPAQGALAIECRADDLPTRQRLAAFDHPETAAHVLRERQVLSEWGGGCHQALGATSFCTPDDRHRLSIRGRKPDGTLVSDSHDEVPSPAPQRTCTPATPKPGSRLRLTQTAHWISGTPAASTALFIPRPQCADDSAALPIHRVWAGDLSTWHSLARAGIWVEGSAEGLGLEWILPTLEEPVLGFDTVHTPFDI